MNRINKSIYKQWWFWLMIILFISVIGSKIDTSDVKSSTAATQDTQSHEKSKEEATENATKPDKVYGIGEKLVYSENGKDLYTFTVNSVKTTDKRNKFSEKKVEQVIVINYSYENLNDPEDVYIFSMNFNVIDADGNVAETYPALDELSPKKAPIGSKSHGEESYGLIHKSNKIKFYFIPNGYGTTRALFELPIA